MILLGLLPAVFLVLTALAVGAQAWRRRGEVMTRREAALTASLLGGALVALGTEVLSLAHALALPGVLAVWSVAAGLAGAAVVRDRAAVVQWLRRRRAEAQRPGTLGRGLGALCVLVIVLAGAAAALSPPNTFDALSYHLPRQLFWIQAAAADHYPTSSARELALSPLAEYAGVHMMILSGGDRYANLISWGAAGLSLAAVSLIVRELGGGGAAQRFGAALAAINPEFYLGASTAKNDMVLTLWLCVLAWLMVRTAARARCDGPMALRIGGAAGLALATKGTAIMYGLPLCAAIGAVMLAREGWRALPKGALIGLCIVAATAGPSWRNMRTFGSPLGPRAGETRDFALGCTVHSPAAIASNILRNLALHAAFVPSPLDGRVVAAVRCAHEALGIAPMTPADDVAGRTFDLSPTGLYSESSAVAPVQVLALFLAGAALAVRGRSTGSWRLGVLALSVAAGAVLFCALLKWQEWNARLHLPPITLGMAVVASLRLPRRLALGGGGAAILAGLGLLVPTVLWNTDRPLLTARSFVTSAGTRALMYRAPRLDTAMAELTAELRRAPPARVRVSIAGPVRYVVLRALARDVPGPPRFDDLRPDLLADAVVAEPRPDLIIVYGVDRPRLLDWPGGTVFDLALRAPPLALYRPGDPSRPRGAGEPVMSHGVFSGWSACEGLAEVAAPTRNIDWKWRAGLLPRTTLSFDASGPMSLIMNCRRGPGGDGTMTIRLNGREVSSHRIAGDRAFHPIEVALPARPGPNELVIEYGAAPTQVNPNPMAVLFTWLQIAPPELP